MAGNSFGERFRITTFGESHGPALGVVVDGCPAGLPFPFEAIQTQLSRRRPGQGKLSTQRKEADVVEVLSGLQADTNLTLGTPIAMLVRNQDAKSQHYSDIAQAYRPSHADYTYDARYGLRAVAGGGRASARETIGRVAAGALAQEVLAKAFNIEIVAWVSQVADITCTSIDPFTITREQVDAFEVRCPEPASAEAMTQAIDQARKQGDTVGGVLSCVARNVPAGWGEPVFDKLTASLAHAMMSLPAARGVEFGDGFAAATMRGSQHNDAFYREEDGSIHTRTNHSGGIQGGISNGENVLVRVGFKPIATIFQEQETVTNDGQSVQFAPKKGRHDPCVVARAVPMVEAMMSLVLCDHMLRSQAIRQESLR